jgi:hypothetical protein
MDYTDDADLRSMIEDQLELLKERVSSNGAVLASPNGHYQAHWVRDLVDYREEDRKSFPTHTEGSEAQWPFGFAWLSIVYSKRAKKLFARGEDHGESKAKAREYLDKLKGCAIVAAVALSEIEDPDVPYSSF